MSGRGTAEAICAVRQRMEKHGGETGLCMYYGIYYRSKKRRTIECLFKKSGDARERRPVQISIHV